MASAATDRRLRRFRGFTPENPTTFEKVDETFNLDSLGRSSWSKLGNAKFTAGRRVGVLVPSGDRQAPTEPAGEKPPQLPEAKTYY